MKKLFILFIALLIVAPVFSQWEHGNLSGVKPKVRESIVELRNRSAIGVMDDIWYVDANNGIDTRGGKSWDKAFASLTKALTLAGDYDVIMVAPGDYEEDGVLNITEAGLRIYGPGRDNQHHAMIYVSDSSNHAMTINAHHVVIDGIGFTVNKDEYDAIRVSTTASYHKATIRNCRFDGYGNGEYAIHTGTTFDSPDIIVENCVFRSWQTACIYANATRGVYRNNTFLLVAAKIGIEVVPTTGGRPDQIVADNIIKGVNSTDTGIKITNSPSENALVIKGNHVVNCAVPVSLSKYTSFYEDNYWGVEDWRYHRETGRAGAVERGADGNLFYVDGNISTAGDSKCWASAGKVLATSLALSHTDIAVNRNWARRNTVYLIADGVTEDLVALAGKTDIVGCGSNDAFAGYAEILGNHVIASAYGGCRIYNVLFEEADDGVIMTLPDGADGVEFHGCLFDGQSSNPTTGILATGVMKLKVIGCEFTDTGSGFSTAAISLAAGNGTGTEISDNIIRASAVGILVNASFVGTNSLISGNMIIASTLVIDDNSNVIPCIGNRCITLTTNGENTAWDLNQAIASDNYVTSNEPQCNSVPDMTQF